MSPMTEGPDYRKRADECTALAQSARTPAQRTMLLHIADTWRRLAREADENDHADGRIEMSPPARRLM